jgi:two-component system cell cycle response regulator
MEPSTMPSTVLVIGQSAQVRQDLSMRAAEAGYEVVAALAPGEGLPGTGTAPVDAILCQVGEEEGQWRSFVERVREDHNHACILVVGPNLPAEEVAALLRAGAFDYLTLPVRASRLTQALEEGLAVRRSFIQVQQLSSTLQQVNRELQSDRDRLQQWNRNLRLLNQLGQTISATLETDEIVRAIGPRLEEMIAFDVVGIVWSQPERVWIHVPNAQDALYRADMAPNAMRERLLERNRRFVEASLSSADEHGGPPVDADLPSDVLEIPLVVADRVLGMLHIARCSNRAFDPDERELVKAVAMSLALGLRNAETHSEVQRMALRDALTGLLNRRALSNILTRKIREAERYRAPLCLIMADIDHFKMLNDRYGHLVGDQVLKEIGQLLTKSVRSVDVVTRYGGEEFAIVLPDTDLAQAMTLANRVRETIGTHEFNAEGVTLNLALSMGVARIPDPRVKTMEDLILLADQALYRAKAVGRNRVECLEMTTEDGKQESLAGLRGMETNR